MYVITSQRALILHKIEGSQIDVRVISPSEMSERVVTVTSDTSGDLTFPNVPFVIRWGNRTVPKEENSGKYKVGFYGISDVRAVDDLLRCTFETVHPL